MPHRFRFFVDAAGCPGAVVGLAPHDASHARVLRLAPGDVVDVVAAGGELYGGVVEQVDQTLVTLRLGPLRTSAGAERWAVELFAGVLTGGTFDDLVDGAVQAGATRVVPVAATSRERERIAQRAERLRRVATSAAKQAKRTVVPEVAAPMMLADLLASANGEGGIGRADAAGGAGGAGIVLDPSGASPLIAAVEAIAAEGHGAPIRLLVGPSQGIADADLDALVAAGWRAARLGPTVLRSELAAAVAVAQAAAVLADLAD